MKLTELEAVIEALLFIAGEAVPLSTIAQTIEMDKATTKAMIQGLVDKYEKEMKQAAKDLQFERAAQLRDIIYKLKKQIKNI